MAVTYFKRFKMQIGLEHLANRSPIEFEDYEFWGWNSRLLSQHAEAKYESFCDELDSHVFPCLGEPDGCLKLMNEISCRNGFVPESTWLLVHQTPGSNHYENCGTVQGIRTSKTTGSIQNLGIARAHRGRGLGTELLVRSLLGFASVGMQQVSLEVTVHNSGALELYKKLGFTVTDIVYKSADLKY